MALGIVVVGFPLYWLSTIPALNLLGLFIAGLGVANLFPLTLSVAVGVAADQANKASARVALAGGLAGFLTVGLLGSTLDVARMGLLFYLLVFASGLSMPAHTARDNR